MNKHQKPIIGIMGPGNPNDPVILEQAEQLGRRIAKMDWILLTGGRRVGVMHAASKGAAEADGEVIGILPDDSRDGMSEYVSIPILTGVGSARNVINILTADVVIVCGMGLGTASEASLAIKRRKPIVFTKIKEDQFRFFQSQCKKILHQFNEADPLIDFVEKELL